MTRLFVIAAVALVVAGCFPARPSIDDPNQLVRDCTPLVSAKQEGTIDSGHWPASLQKLRPLEVRHIAGALIITTFRATGQGARGYIIAPQEPHLDHYQLTASGSPNIYDFEFIP